MNDNDVLRLIQAYGQINRLAISSPEEATPFGCCNFFDDCTDGIFSLYYRGQLGLLDWMGFNPTDVCYRRVDFINYVRPAQENRADTVGYISNPCADPNGIEFGGCHLDVEDFGLYGREGPTRKLLKPSRWCKNSPRKFLDGSPITSEFDWDSMFTMDQILNDVRVAVVTGNTATPGQFDGLQRWVRTGYDCTALNSYVVNWNNNPMSGGAGITLNGGAAPAGFNLVDWLQDIHRNVKERTSWSPLLSNQARRVGDTIIVLPGFMARCLLDFFTCWSTCPSLIDTATDATRLVKEVPERNDFRIQLNGGMFGHGRIFLDGDEIPLLIYDWGMINGPTRGDLYYLTGAIGSQRVWEGEHLSAEVAMRELMGANGVTGADLGYFSRDNGRVLGLVEVDNLCRILKLWMAPRLWCMAPWAQARFQNISCHTPTGPLSPNPADTSFYPETSFTPATCP
jgi:hypothetical protein